MFAEISGHSIRRPLEELLNLIIQLHDAGVVDVEGVVGGGVCVGLGADVDMCCVCVWIVLWKLVYTSYIYYTNNENLGKY